MIELFLSMKSLTLPRLDDTNIWHRSFTLAARLACLHRTCTAIIPIIPSSSILLPISSLLTIDQSHIHIVVSPPLSLSSSSFITYTLPVCGSTCVYPTDSRQIILRYLYKRHGKYLVCGCKFVPLELPTTRREDIKDLPSRPDLTRPTLVFLQ